MIGAEHAGSLGCCPQKLSLGRGTDHHGHSKVLSKAAAALKQAVSSLWWEEALTLPFYSGSGHAPSVLHPGQLLQGA